VSEKADGQGAASVSPHSIVVGIDGSDCAEDALRWAVRQARLTGQDVHAVIAWGYPLDVGVRGVTDFNWQAVAGDLLRTTVAKAVDPADAGRVHQHVVEGHPARALLDVAADADLLVVGYRGHGGFGGTLLGSVAQRVVAAAPCPVLVVREGADQRVRG
jgi:nucleotide-binding universal stress UspA family protein